MKALLISILISMSMLAHADETSWLLEKTAKPLEVETGRIVIVCTQESGCQPVIIYGGG